MVRVAEDAIERDHHLKSFGTKAFTETIETASLLSQRLRPDNGDERHNSKRITLPDWHTTCDRALTRDLYHDDAVLVHYANMGSRQGYLEAIRMNHPIPSVGWILPICRVACTEIEALYRDSRKDLISTHRA